MKTSSLRHAALVLISSTLPFLVQNARAAAPLEEIKTHNTPRTFPRIDSREQWSDHARQIREQILVSAGLWPLPEKPALNARVFGRVERDGYTIEKACFESWPGFFVAGNLYRPLGQGAGPFPGILNPHGHWKEGRLADGPDCSAAARCIQFARMGMVAFTFDMVGYNDTVFPDHVSGIKSPADFYLTHRRFATNVTHQLWNISLMGLQTWNTIRALDFLESLPDVDKSRLASTGESGGGTQAFLLGAIDNRLAVQAPIVMVSHIMQGGCFCENMPGLRVEFSNMEFAAAPAPRPQIMVAATGDWTKTTMTIEGPGVASIYKIFGAPENLHYEIHNAPHNYNQVTRESVYGWFNRWLLHAPNSAPVPEIAYRKEPDEMLRVFPEGKLPAKAVTEAQLIDHLKKNTRDMLTRLAPRDAASLHRYRETLVPAWQRTMQVDLPERGLRAEVQSSRKLKDYTVTEVSLGQKGFKRRTPVTVFTSDGRYSPVFAVLASPDGRGAFLDAEGNPTGLAAALVAKKVSFLILDPYQTTTTRDQVTNFFTTYNRTDLQERVHDLVIASAFARGTGKGPRAVALVGTGRAGLWTLLAAPGADAVAADANTFRDSGDEVWLAPDLFVPGIRNVGGIDGVLALAAPHPLLVHNAGGNFDVPMTRTAYAKSEQKNKSRVEARPLSDAEIARWIDGL